MQQIARMRVFVTLHGRSRIQVSPAAEPGALQNAADGGGTEGGGACDLIAGSMLPAQLDDAIHQFGRCGAWTAEGSRGAVAEPLGA